MCIMFPSGRDILPTCNLCSYAYLNVDMCVQMYLLTLVSNSREYVAKNNTKRQRKLNEKNRFSVVVRLFLLLHLIYDI